MNEMTDPRAGGQNAMFRDVSPDELRSVEGGRSWLGRAWDWVKRHVSVSGHDMSGNPAVVVTVH
jgi:hypothetical protein